MAVYKALLKLQFSYTLPFCWQCFSPFPTTKASPLFKIRSKGRRSSHLPQLPWSQLVHHCVCVCAMSLQSCPAVCDPVDCSPPGSSVHGVLQARVLEWVFTSSSRGSSRPRDGTRVSHVSCIGRRILIHCATREVQVHHCSMSNHTFLTTHAQLCTGD